MLNNSISPAGIIVTTAIIGMLAIIIILLYSLKQPYVGISLNGETDINAWLIDRIDKAERYPNLKSGQQVTQLHLLQEHNHHQEKFIIIPWKWTPADPDSVASFKDYDAFFARQATLANGLRKDKLGMELKDGSIIWVAIEKKRPLQSLPGVVWLSHTLGLAALIIGALVLVFAKAKIPARLIFLIALGYFITQITNGFYIPREIALPETIFRVTSFFNHAGGLLFAFSILSLLSCYPNRITNKPLIRWYYLLMTLFIINELGHWQQWPLHHSFFPYLLLLLSACFVVWRQWQLSQNDAIARAIMLWLALTFVVISTLVVALYFIPHLFGSPPLVNIWIASSLLFVMFIGLVAGVARFRLFDMEMIWHHAWLWSLGGLAVVICDLFLIYAINIYPDTALVISVLLVGWAWFPVRQYVMQRILGTGRQTEQFLPQIISMFLSLPKSGDASAEYKLQTWLNILQKSFNFSHWQYAHFTPEVKLKDQGLNVVAPIPSTEQAIIISGKNNGKQLFNPHDITFIQSLNSLAEKVLSLKAASDKSRSDERKRIMRDLHDDVCPLLLTLVHQQQDAALIKKSQLALTRLRDTIYSLDDDSDNDLIDLLDDLQIELKERAQHHHIQLEWNLDLINENTFINARQRINIKRIFHEAMSNCVSHSDANMLSVNIIQQPNRLHCLLQDNSTTSTSPEKWAPGKGIHNMKTRADEIGGDIQWCYHSGLTIEINIPLSDDSL